MSTPPVASMMIHQRLIAGLGHSYFSRRRITSIVVEERGIAASRNTARPGKRTSRAVDGLAGACRLAMSLTIVVPAVYEGGRGVVR